MSKNRKIIILAVTFLTLFFAISSYVSAQGNLDPFGGTKVNLENQLGLGNEDPRIVIANIIRIALGFLGIIAVGLVLYAGFLWMTAAGAADKIERAKKILIGAVIGLIIILASFGIATFILNSMLAATGGAGGPGGPGGPGPIPGPGPGPGPGPVTCDDNGDPFDGCGLPLACPTSQFCNTASCLCQNLGGLGDDCNATTTPSVCEPDDSRCDSLLRCDTSGPTACTCQGAPVIDWLSPGAGTPGNFVTIGGRYFGTTTGGQVFFSDATGSTTIPAAFPNTINPACTNNWQDNQIIVVVPAGAATGPIRVRRADTLEDTTDNGRGPLVDDFVIDGIVRPGLCLASPASGQFNDNFTLQGANFAGASRRVLFGNESASTTANISTPWTGSSVGAAVPNIRAGRNTVFVDVDNRASNGLNFQVSVDPDNTPIIEYIDPPQGPAKQYITIYGRNFKTYLDSTSRVEFTAGATTVEADTSFPAQCRNNWWHDQYILVKVPSDAVPVGAWQITVTNRNAIESAPADFPITIGSAGPGLCLLDPHNGPVNQSIAAVGERFGDSQGAGGTEFYNAQPGLVSVWSNLEIENNVPIGAETGPFFVSDGTTDSNSLPFTVGKCSASTECESGEECCAGGTYDGICRIAGSCGEGIAPACTFGWTFTTAPGGTTPPTCRGYSGAAACMAAGNCPNSPGQCQSESGAVLNRCDNVYCNDTFSICAGDCEYDPALDKCKSVSATCNQTDTTLLAGYTAQCRVIGSSGYWQINSPANCPTGGATSTFRGLGDWCYLGLPGSPSGCDLCSNGFTCQAGECVINRDICPTGSDCTAGECVKTDSTCECCCRLANSAQDCCLGLTCEPRGCGASADGCDPATDPTCTYGQCTGCRVELDSNRATYSAQEEVASDQACNCYGGSPTRYCSVDLTDLSNPSNVGVCADAALLGEDCYDPITAATCESTDPPCAGGLYCNPAAGCTCADPTGLSCDGDPVAPNCQDTGLCGADTCNTSTCLCEPTDTTVVPGARCIPPVALPACTAGVADCGSNYDCLSEASADCRCCCTPGDTLDVVSSSGATSTLTCIANKTPCNSTDDSRGLYCGCSEDAQCGDPDVVGCGLDSCCYSRPTIVTVEPPEDSIDQCRNPLISATFDQPMDVASFSGSVIVLGDFGTGACPAGTTYLTAGKYLKLGRLARFWLRVKSIFIEDAMAQATNFCAITGLVSGYPDADGNSVLTFSPSEVLDAGRTYTVIIKGDDLTTTSTEGVRNNSGVGMNGPDNETYNGIPFSGRIWSFTTMDETADNDGICRLEYVDIEPASYVLTTLDNDTTDDTSLSSDSEPMDSDKIFAATARSSAGAAIVPVAGYDWTWNLISENDSIARVVASSSAPARALVRAQNQKDGKTYFKASATIDDDLINSPSTAGKIKSAKARVYVFICENPWPPVIDPTDWPWYDEGGNCDIDAASCVNNNFEFYYCRDSGSKGTANDLPAITRDPAVRGSSTAPSNLLKEFFFTRADLPTVTVLTASDQLSGGRVLARWTPVTGAGGYKLYYGSASKSYQTVREVDTSVCAADCQLFVDGLTNNQRYYFAVTAFFTNDRAESAYSNEEVKTPTDTWPPALPAGFTPTPATGAVDLIWTTVSSSDLAGYRVYYGTADGVYGASVDAEKAEAITITGLSSGVTYWFMLGAYDQYNNVATTTAASATPL